MRARHRQHGLSIISTLIVGAFIAAALILALKLVPVFTEYLAIKKAFSGIIERVDAQQPAAAFRAAFYKYAQIDDISSVNAQSIVVTKENGRAVLSVDYERRVALFANVSLVFEFSVASDGAAGTSK